MGHAGLGARSDDEKKCHANTKITAEYVNILSKYHIEDAAVLEFDNWVRLQ